MKFAKKQPKHVLNSAWTIRPTKPHKNHFCHGYLLNSARLLHPIKFGKGVLKSYVASTTENRQNSHMLNSHVTFPRVKGENQVFIKYIWTFPTCVWIFQTVVFK